MPDQQLSGGQKKLPELYYMKMIDNEVDARLGKLRSGQIVAMPEEVATRFLQVGVAEQATSAEYQAQQERRAQKVSARQNAFAALSESYSVWDVSTYRDVLTAPEKGLRLAAERGVPLVNVHMLRDDEGDPLAPDADIEDILEARKNMHPDLMFPFAAHERSSVMGGGSMYVQNIPLADPRDEPQGPSTRRAQRRAEASNPPKLNPEQQP